MKKIKLLIILVLIMTMGLNTGCMTMRRREEKNNRENDDLENLNENLDDLEKQIMKMTLDEKIGQLMIVGFDSMELDEGLEKRLLDLKPGGLILFKRNVFDTKQLVRLLNDIKTYNEKVDNIPMFISTDEEGGSVSRMPKDINVNPSARELGNLSDKKLVEDFSSQMAETLVSLGINTNNAPVLDVRYNPNNELTKTRAFGDNEKEVAELGEYFLNGMEDKNVLAVAKHFPGHGSTDVDSHYNLPIVTKSYNDLMNQDIFPFKAAINQGVDGIMVGHVMYRELDNRYPASMSHKIITELLIKQLGYRNLIFSDDMTMGAITNTSEPETAGIEFLKAGGDVALFCHGDSIGYEFKIKMKKEIENGKISEKEIDKKVYKILKIKEKYNMNNKVLEGPNVKEINKNYEKLKLEKDNTLENQRIEKIGD